MMESSAARNNLKCYHQEIVKRKGKKKTVTQPRHQTRPNNRRAQTAHVRRRKIIEISQVLILKYFLVTLKNQLTVYTRKIRWNVGACGHFTGFSKVQQLPLTPVEL